MPGASPAAHASPSPADLRADGLRLFRQGQYEAALARFRAAETVFREQGDAGMATEMLNNQGVVHRLRRRWPEARQALQAAADGFAALDDPGRQGQALANLGDVHAARKERRQAAALYGQAAALLAQAGDPVRQSQVLRAMSLDQLRRGGVWAAISLMERSLAIRPRLGLGGWLFRWLLRLALRLLSGGA